MAPRPLGEALSEARAVPADFVEAGKAAFAWHDLDAELAALPYDSQAERAAVDHEPVSGGPVTGEFLSSEFVSHEFATREQHAVLRAMTFESAEQSVDLEVVHEALRGQLMPAAPGQVELHTPAGEVAAFAVDALGYFVIAPIPSGPFRLGWRTLDGVNRAPRG